MVQQYCHYSDFNIGYCYLMIRNWRNRKCLLFFVIKEVKGRNDFF